MSMSFPDAPLAVAVDIGGTFTDVALSDPSSQRVWRAKTPSRPDDPSAAFVTGIRLALEAAGQSPQTLAQVLHGTTVATNMILEGKGAKTALVTTRGFRHVLTIGRQDIPRSANLYTWRKPGRPVPPERVHEVDERIGPGGIVLRPLDEASVHAVADALRAAGVEAVAICLLHAFANDAHEARVADILRDSLPGVAVTASSDVLPVVREFERSMTVVLNATVMPGINTYVGRVEERLRDEGVTAPLLLMQSNGGVASAQKIRKAPALTALSGPAAGVVGACAVAAEAGIEDIITVDIGGTSADISLVKGGRINLTEQGSVGGWPLPLPMVDMVTIGAGGGSIARVTDGTLAVGPDSAGADPGPAAYGQGGQRPTVTDAHVVLGHLPPQLLGGQMQLDVVAAAAAVSRGVAEPLGLSLHDAARGILAISNNAMIGAIRVVSVERGHDPRDFTLVPFGGAGPLHGTALADLLGIRRVLIAEAPGVLCADGLLHADLRATFARTLPVPTSLQDADTVALRARLETEAQDWFDAERVPEAARRIQLRALLRFLGQGSELAVLWHADPDRLEERFAAEHETLFGYRQASPVEIVALRLEARAAAPDRPRGRSVAPDGSVRQIGTSRMVLPDGERDVPVLDRTTLAADDTVQGPAILSQLDTTTLVPPGWRATALPSGALLMTRTGETS